MSSLPLDKQLRRRKAGSAMCPDASDVSDDLDDLDDLEVNRPQEMKFRRLSMGHLKN